MLGCPWLNAEITHSRAVLDPGESFAGKHTSGLLSDPHEPLGSPSVWRHQKFSCLWANSCHWPHFPKYTAVCCTLDSPPPAPNLSPSCSPPLCHAQEPSRASLHFYSSQEMLLLGLRAFLRAEQEMELRQAKTSPGDGLRIRPQEETCCASCSPPLLCTVSPSTKPLCFPPQGARLQNRKHRRARLCSQCALTHSGMIP